MKEKVEKARSRERPVKLDWKDFLALTIAALETSLLPIVVVLLVLVALLLVLPQLFHG